MICPAVITCCGDMTWRSEEEGVGGGVGRGGVGRSGGDGGVEVPLHKQEPHP